MGRRTDGRQGQDRPDGGPPAETQQEYFGLNRKGCPGCADRLMLWHGAHFVDGEPVMRCEAEKE